MHSYLKTRVWIIIFLLVFIFPTLVLLPDNPSYQSQPNRDSGVFLYIGQQWLNGLIPYKDVWDHKPPLIFIINALGLILSNGTEWGIWWIQFVFFISASGICYLVLYKTLDHFSAVFGSTIVFTTLFVIWEGTNFTEQYSILFQFLALLFFYEYQSQIQSKKYLVLIGLTASLSFLLKQNLIGIWIAIIIYLIIDKSLMRDWRTLSSEVCYFIFGATLLPLFVTIYFYFHGALGDLIIATFKYNFVYATSNSISWWKSLKYGIILTSFSGGMIIALISWISWGLFLIFSHPIIESIRKSAKSLLIVALIGFPIELAMATISGNIYHHYYIAWLPTISILCGFFVLLYSSIISKGENKFSLIAILILISMLPFYMQTVRLRKLGFPKDERENQVINFIYENSSKEDFILMWGAESYYNYKTRRQAPSRFVYQYPLFIGGIHEEEFAREFLSDLISHKPQIIIDTSYSNPIVPNIRSHQSNHELLQVEEFIRDNYSCQYIFGESLWEAYLINK